MGATGTVELTALLGNASEYTGPMHPGASLISLLLSASTGVHSTRATCIERGITHGGY